MIRTTNFSNYANVYCNVIRVIRVIRSLVAFVFVQKYVIEVYVSMSFCLLISFCLSNVFTVGK